MNLFDDIVQSSTNQFLAKPIKSTQPSFTTPQAPRTVAYTEPVVTKPQPKVIQKPSTGVAPGFDATPREERPVYDFLQSAADVVTSLPSRLRETVGEDKKRFDEDIKKKQVELANEMLAKGYKKEDIFKAFDTLQEKGEFDFKPGFAGRLLESGANRIEETIDTTERLSKQPNDIKSAITGTIAYGGDIIGAGTDIIGAGLQPVVEPIIKGTVGAIDEYTDGGATSLIKKGSDWYSIFKKENPNLADTIEGATNIASIAPIPKVTGLIKKGTNSAIDTAKSGVSAVSEFSPTSVVKPIVNAPKKIVQGGVDVLEKIKPGLKDDLASIDPQSRYAVERATPERVSTIIEDAKQAKQNPDADYQQTPYHKGAEMANQTIKTIEDNLQKRQNERMAILKNVPLKTIDLSKAREAIVKEFDKLNVAGVDTVDGKIKILPKEGRSALLDSDNASDMKAIEKLKEVLGKDASPLQTMDNIKILQEWLYENKGTIAIKGISKKMEQILSKVQSSLNKTFKDQLPPEYRKVMDSLSEDITMNDKLKKLFGIDDSGNPVGNRGELVMKRLTNGTTTGGEARTLAKEILDKYGIDLIQEARLRQLSMELVGDTRGANLFGVLLSGKKGMMDWALGKVGEILIDKENLIKSYAGKGPITKPKKQPTLYTKPK